MNKFSMLKRGAILFFLVLLTVNNFAQQKEKTSTKELWDDGEYFFWSEDYEEAVFYYLELFRDGYDNANIRFKIGACYVQIKGEETKAIPYLEYASGYIVADYKHKSIEEVSAPHHTLFYLGNAYRMDNQLDRALETYELFVSSPYYVGRYNEAIVRNEIKTCERAKIIQDRPLSLERTNLGAFINTAASEFNPLVTADDKVLVYVTKLKFYDAIMYSIKQDDGQWAQPININPQILSDGDLYPTGISADGKTLLFVKIRRDKFKDIWYSTLNSNNLWSEAKPLSDINGARSNEGHASFSTDGKTLVVSSDRNGGYGGYDIYFSKMDEDGQWGKLVNAGKTINTPEDEITPFFPNGMPDDNILFFSSKGHYNMGGYDIFFSLLNDKGKWGVPFNVGFPISTTSDDTFYFPIGDGTEGYYSVKDTDGFGSFDIYKIKISSKLFVPQEDSE